MHSPRSSMGSVRSERGSSGSTSSSSTQRDRSRRRGARVGPLPQPRRSRSGPAGGPPPVTDVAAVLAVDGGNSKADVALLAADGTLLGAVRGPTISHQVVPVAEAAHRLRSLIDRAAADAGLSDVRPRVVVACVAGADYPEDVRLL